MSDRRENAGLVIILAACLVLACAFMYAARLPYNEAGDFYGFNYNLLAYVGILAAVFGGFLLLRAISGLWTKKAGTVKGVPAAIFSCIYVVCACVLLAFVYEIYRFENAVNPENTSAEYIRQLAFHRLYFCGVILIAALLFFTLDRKNVLRRRRLRFALGAVFALYNGVADFCLNPFVDGGGGSIHVHAVTNTIVNIARGIPYSSLNNSIYGHFALLCLPFVKLFGNDFTAIAMTLSLFGAISFSAAFYAASKLIRRDDVFMLSLAAITATTSVLSRKGIYYQINPLRFLGPCLTLACIAYELSQGKKHGCAAHILEFAVGVLAIVCNFETGVFSVLTLAATHVYITLEKNRFFSRACFGRILLEAVSCVGCGLAAWVLVGLYNILCGGTFGTMREFIYPLLSGTYNVNHLRMPLPIVPCFYVLEIIAFFSAILIAIWKRPFLSEAESGENDRYMALLFATGLSGLFSLIYFINRTAYGNMAISTIQMGILLGALSQEVLTVTHENVRTVLKTPVRLGRFLITGVVFIALVFSAVEGTLYLGISLLNRALPGEWSREGIESVETWIEDTVPEDAVATGFMLPELYFDMGRDPHVTLTDWSDINDINREHVKEELLKHDHILIEESTTLGSWLKKQGNFQEVSRFSIGNRTYVYYELE